MSAPGSAALRVEGWPGSIAALILDQPGSRVNTLSQAVLAEFEQVLSGLDRRSDLKGLVFCSGKPGHFIAGADIKELGAPGLTPEVIKRLTQRGLDIIARLESLPYPTLAAIDGACVGGGLEFALGCDFRLATTQPKTELGAPEVKIGLIPGWGGTQRLARVIGPPLAIEMVCTGEPISASRALELGLVFDAVPAEKLVEEARRLLQWAAQSGTWREVRRKKQQPVGLTDDQFTFLAATARAQILAKTKGQLPAPPAALDAVLAGCNLPLAEGLRAESERFIPLVGSTVSRNLIAVFFMGQRLQKDPGVADLSIKPRTIEKVGVLGAGLMGAGIAGAYLRRGIPVVMLDTVPQALDKGIASLRRVLQGRVDAGRMPVEEMNEALGRLTTTASLTAMADRDLVIEAIIENEAAKADVYRQLQTITRADSLLASNTSTISISRLAQSVGRPEHFAGMHFFNPVDRMQLVEVIRGEKTSDETVATLVALAKRVDKTPIVVCDCPGFLVNRVLFPYLNESLVLMEEGASPRAIDRAATDFGMPMGPVSLNDLVGLDTSLYAGRVINTAFPDRAVSTAILEDLVASGRLGQKSGAGFYTYAKGSRGADDPALAPVIDRHRTARRDLAAEELTDRLFLPMVTEASRILEEGIVREPADVDMGLILGTGFPTYRGGLLRWADTLGLQEVLTRLERYRSLGRRFEPTDQIRRLASGGKGFYVD